MKKTVLYFAVILMLAFSVNVFAEVKVGIFDMQEVMVKSLAGENVKKTLQQKKEYYTKEIKKKEASLKNLRQELEKKSMMMSQEAKDKAEKDYQKKLRDLKLYASDSENDLKNLYKEKTQMLVHNILLFARKFAEKNGYTLVIERQEGGIVFADKTIDITDKILQGFNENYLKNKK
jgi:outer membrane protein